MFFLCLGRFPLSSDGDDILFKRKHFSLTFRRRASLKLPDISGQHNERKPRISIYRLLLKDAFSCTSTMKKNFKQYDCVIPE